MEKFVDLGISYFDRDFVLDPYPYLEDLYPRTDVLGFRASGMDFVFRFEQAREVIVGRACRREPMANPEIEAMEQRYAERYPNRARFFRLAFCNATGDGKTDFALKKLIMDFMDETARVADFSGAEPVYRRLARPGRVDDFVESLQTLPLRIMLESCGLPFSEDDLLALTRSGFDFNKALDNFIDEGPIAAADAAAARTTRWVEESLPAAPADSRIAQLMAGGRAKGIADERLIANVGNFLIQALANTAGISAALMLRTLTRFPHVRKALAEQPERIHESDQVVMEFLRRDNHVKSLSRQVHRDFELGGFPMQRGESLFLFFPGINLDPTHWTAPLEVDIERQFTGMNHVIFGSSAYMCIGKKLGISFLQHMLTGLVAHLPEGARVLDEEVEVDDGWISERIITRMPIVS